MQFNFLSKKQKNKKSKELIVLIGALIGIVAVVFLIQRITQTLTGAFGETVNVSLVPNNAQMPPDRSISIYVNAKTNKIGFSRVKVSFNPQKIKLASEAIQTNTLATVLEKTTMAQANTTGTLILALGLATFDKATPPTGTFEIARLPFTTVSTIKNDSTTVTIDNADIQIAEMAQSALPHTTTGITINLNTSVVPTPIDTNTVTLTPVEDTYVSAYKPTTNFGNSSILSVDSGVQREIAYLKFDLSSLAGKTIDSAILRYKICTGTDCPSGAAQDVHIVSNSTWNENTMVWGNRPSLGSILASEDGGEAGVWKSMEISAGVQSYEGKKVSVAFTQNSEDGISFYSSESSNAPQLIIKYADSSISQNGTLTLKATKDAWVDKGNPAANFGSDKQLSVRNSTQMMTYLSFDLSRLGGKKISSAKLRMHTCNLSNCGSGSAQNVRSVTNDWSEQSIVFNNKPASVSLVGTLPGGSMNKWIETDITSGVKGKEGSEVVSFELDQASIDGIYFDSKEAGTDLSPQLIVTYSAY